LKKLDRFDTLGQRQRPINWMVSCDRHPISANSRERHVWLKRPFVGLPIGLQKRCAQGGDCIGSATVNPEQPGPSRLRPITRMPEYQLKSAEPAGNPAELLDRIGYRSLVPRGHKSEMNIGWRDRPDKRLFESCSKPRELTGDLRHDLQADKHARRRRSDDSVCVSRTFRVRERHRW
jgi:hypothetical protein